MKKIFKAVPAIAGVVSVSFLAGGCGIGNIDSTTQTAELLKIGIDTLETAKYMTNNYEARIGISSEGSSEENNANVKINIDGKIDTDNVNSVSHGNQKMTLIENDAELNQEDINLEFYSTNDDAPVVYQKIDYSGENGYNPYSDFIENAEQKNGWLLNKSEKNQINNKYKLSSIYSYMASHEAIFQIEKNKVKKNDIVCYAVSGTIGGDKVKSIFDEILSEDGVELDLKEILDMDISRLKIDTTAYFDAKTGIPTAIELDFSRGLTSIFKDKVRKTRLDDADYEFNIDNANLTIYIDASKTAKEIKIPDDVKTNAYDISDMTAYDFSSIHFPLEGSI